MNTVISDLAHRAAAGVHSAVVKTDDAISTASNLNAQLFTLLKDVGLTVIIVALLIGCWKKGWAAAGVISAVLVGSFGIWIVHGNGMEVLAGIWGQTFSG